MTVRESAVAAEILRIAHDDLGIDGQPDAAEALQGALDSLQLLSLVVAVEDRFRIILEDDDAARARSVEDLARIVAARADPALLPAAAVEARSP
jgi:acyl carrier protein